MLSLLLVGIGFSLTLPPVQTRLIAYTKEIIADNLGLNLKIGEVDIGLPNWVILRNITLYDKQNIPVLNAESIEVEVIRFTLRDFIKERDSLQELTIGRVELVSPDIRLYTSCKSGKLNLLEIFEKAEKTRDSLKKDRPLRLNFILDDILIEKAKFTFRDSVSDNVSVFQPQRINYHNISISNLNLLAHFKKLEEKRLDIFIESLNFEETYSGFHLDKFRGKIINDAEPTLNEKGECITEGVFKISDLTIESGNTRLSAYLELPGQTLQMVLRGEAPQYYIFLNPSSFEFEILNHFIPPIPPRGIVNAQGEIRGNLDGLKAFNLKATHGKEIAVNGNVTIKNWNDPKALTLDIKVDKGNVSGKALRELLPDIPLPAFLDNIEKSDFSGTFQGQSYYFFVNTDIHSPIGRVVSDIHLQIPPLAKVKKLTYEGLITTYNLNFDAIQIVRDVKISQNLNFDGKIKGTGTDWEGLVLDAKGKISGSSIVGLAMDSVFADISIANKRIKGYTWIDDGVGRVNTEIDLNLADTQHPSYKVKGDIRKLNLKKYKLLDIDLVYSGSVDLNMTGKDLDRIYGDAALTNSVLVYTRSDTVKTLKVSDLAFNLTRFTADSLALSLKSSIGNTDLSGKFLVMDLVKDVRNLVKEVQLYFANNDSALNAYYAAKPASIVPKSAICSLTTGPEANRIFRFFDLPLYVSDSSVLKLVTVFDRSSNINLHYRGDTLAYDSIRFSKPVLTLSMMKNALENKILLSGIMESFRFYPTESIMLENNYVDMEAFGNEVDLTLFTEQPTTTGITNKANIHSTIKYSLDGNIAVSFNPEETNLFYQNYNWKIQGENNFIYYNKSLFVDTLRIITDSLALGENQKLGSQNIVAFGTISPEPDSHLDVLVNNFNIKSITNLYDIGLDLGGTLNAKGQIFDIMNKPKLQATGVLSAVSLEGFVYGDIHLASRWDNPANRVMLESRLILNQDTFLHLIGGYYYKNKENPLDFRLSTQTALPIRYAEPFVKSIFYGLDGSLQFKALTISGSFQDIVIKGSGEFRDAAFGMLYFKTRYTFNGNVEFDKDKIEIKKLSLFDKYQHSADFQGFVRHRGFRNFAFDFQLDRINNFLVMDTRKQDNELFYGSIFVKDGLTSISGDLNKINITAFGVTGKGSILKIPLSDESSYGKPDFIQFTSSAKGDSLKPPVSGTKIEVNITVQATDEAVAELIFDEQIGDIIRGKGNGTINMVISPQGDFTMNGMYEITEGDYLFTSQNLVNKSFKVKPGGRILWDGDPSAAQIDLTAYYPISNANAKSILNTEENLYIPTNVIMHLQGDLLQPLIEPNIELPSLARSGISNQTANDLQAKIKSFEFDQQELNKQVMSLILFNQFAPDNTFSDPVGSAVNIGGLATTSVSEFLSNQVNYWLSKSISDKVNVSVSSTNFQDVNLLISAKLFNDRITVERDGTVVGNNTSFSLGNISVIVKLLPGIKDTLIYVGQKQKSTGQLDLEVFNRSSIGQQLNNANQVGAGIFYKKDFDKFGDLNLRNKRKKHKPLKKDSPGD